MKKKKKKFIRANKNAIVCTCPDNISPVLLFSYRRYKTLPLLCLGQETKIETFIISSLMSLQFSLLAH